MTPLVPEALPGFKDVAVRSIGAGLTALIIGWAAGPWVFAKLKRLKASQALRTQEQVGPLANLHAMKVGTPTMGGIVIYAAVIGSTLLWAQWNLYVLTAIGVYTALTLVGVIDDYLKIYRANSRGLGGRAKLIVQGVVAAGALVGMLSGEESTLKIRELWTPLSGEPLVALMPFGLLAIFWLLVIVGSSNAVNLTDGVDGLAIGCTVTTTLAFAIIAYAAGDGAASASLGIGHVEGVDELAVVSAAVAGAGLAFLWYNAHPATVFMGDAGSLGLGGLLGVTALMVQQPFTLMIVGGVFVAEALSVMVQITVLRISGRRIFRMTPLHHHFELKGCPEAKLVARFWILSLLLALTGLALLKFF